MMFNTLSATKSIEHVNAILHVVQENIPEDPIGALPVHSILDELQNLLVQAAAVSRYFWPSRNAHAWRGAQLRNAFALSDDSPLRSRELRNSIEHFDERLDLFLAGGVTGHVLPSMSVPSRTLKESTSSSSARITLIARSLSYLASDSTCSRLLRRYSPCTND
jgi:hypothetical protein